MADGRRGAALDLFRLAAVVLVVANHTSPLVSVSPLWDFWFTFNPAHIIRKDCGW